MREAYVNLDLCDGCQECVDECRYEAIFLARTPGSKRLKAQVDLEFCCGCHACAVICPQHGIDMVLLKAGAGGA